MTLSSVLVIDDDLQMLEVIAGYVDILGLACRTSQKWKIVSKEILHTSSLIILDLKLPDDDGIDILKELHQEKVKTPILLCTGASEDVTKIIEEVSSSYSLNCIGTLYKPFNIQQFSQAITLASSSKNYEKVIIPERNKPVHHPSNSIPVAEAISNSWFEPYFQPQYSLIERNYIGLECLARLTIPNVGTIAPREFIGQVEAQGLMESFTSKIIEDSLQIYSQVQLSKSMTLSFNIPHSLLTEGFLHKLCLSSSRYGVSNELIILEITESDARKISIETKSVLAKLRLRGFSISLDDFGTGYSSMQDLANIPVNEIKLDKQFVQSINRCKKAKAILESTIRLAGKLGCRVIAEGAETSEQIQALKQMHCHIIQGYYYSRPLPSHELMSLVGANLASIR